MAKLQLGPPPMTFCAHLHITRGSRAYRCEDCNLPVVIHGVPMTLQQVQQFEKMRREQNSKHRRRSLGLVLPGEK